MWTPCARGGIRSRYRQPSMVNGPGFARGEFCFENLAPGAYRLETLKPGWALEEYAGDGRSRSIGGCRQVLVMAREHQGSVRRAGAGGAWPGFSSCTGQARFDCAST